MPGPGGGSRGGGGGRGFGGGFGGGGGSFGGGGRGFGGGYHHHHHYGPRFHGGWFFGPRRYYGGGGCLGGMLGLMMAPVIILLFAGIMLLSVFGSAFGSITTGGEVYYDENTYQDYANEQYAEYFGELEDYEDGLVIVFAVEDVEYYDYAYIAWLGDNIDYEINLMFGARGTKFGNAIISAINPVSYKHSLDSDIAAVMREMADHVTKLLLDNNLTCKHDYKDFDSRLVNKTDIEMTPSTVDTALKDFTKATGIPVIVVVEDADEILPKYFDWFSVIFAVILIVIAVVLIVKALKNRPKKQEDDGSYKGSSQNNYNNGNYDNNNYNNSGW